MTETRAEYEARTGAYPVARYEDLPKAVQEMNFMFKGNVIPHTWYGHIRHKGRTDIAAILILAEIAYWYRPREGKDELTGQVTFAKGFQADKLQKSYGQLEELFGFSRNRVKSAVDRLVKAGLITREFRNIRSKNGMPLSNVMYLEPVTAEVRRITLTVAPSPEKLGGDPPQIGGDGLPQIGGDVYIEHMTESNDNDTAASGLAADTEVGKAGSIPDSQAVEFLEEVGVDQPVALNIVRAHGSARCIVACASALADQLRRPDEIENVAALAVAKAVGNARIGYSDEVTASVSLACIKKWRPLVIRAFQETRVEEE